MLKKKFDKAKALPMHGGYATPPFSPEEINVSSMISAWYFLKKGMQIEPHKSPVKHIFYFIRGKGVMQVGQEKFSVEEYDAVFVPKNVLHTVQNKEDQDLEFIWIGIYKE